MGRRSGLRDAESGRPCEEGALASALFGSCPHDKTYEQSAFLRRRAGRDIAERSGAYQVTAVLDIICDSPIPSRPASMRWIHDLTA